MWLTLERWSSVELQVENEKLIWCNKFLNGKIDKGGKSLFKKDELFKMIKCRVLMEIVCKVQTVQLPLVVQTTVEWSVERKHTWQSLRWIWLQCVPRMCRPSRYFQSSLKMFWFFHKDFKTNQVSPNLHFHRDFFSCCFNVKTWAGRGGEVKISQC